MGVQGLQGDPGLEGPTSPQGPVGPQGPPGSGGTLNTVIITEVAPSQEIPSKRLPQFVRPDTPFCLEGLGIPIRTWSSPIKYLLLRMNLQRLVQMMLGGWRLHQRNSKALGGA